MLSQLDRSRSAVPNNVDDDYVSLFAIGQSQFGITPVESIDVASEPRRAKSQPPSRTGTAGELRARQALHTGAWTLRLAGAGAKAAPDPRNFKTQVCGITHLDRKEGRLQSLRPAQAAQRFVSIDVVARFRDPGARRS